MDVPTEGGTPSWVSHRTTLNHYNVYPTKKILNSYSLQGSRSHPPSLAYTAWGVFPLEGEVSGQSLVTLHSSHYHYQL
jgi:hypothetical protein